MRESLFVDVHGFEPRSGEIFLNFEVEGRGYLAATELKAAGPERDGWVELEVSKPLEFFLKERRGRTRAGEDGARRNWRVRVIGLKEPSEGYVTDVSETGIGVSLSGNVEVEPGTGVTFEFLSGEKAGETRGAAVRYSKSQAGWTRIGAKLQASGFQGPIPIQEMTTILASDRAAGTARRLRMLTSSVKFAASKAAASAGLRRNEPINPTVVRFEDAAGHTIVGLVDGYRSAESPTAVLIPPAWGRTKETLLPLAKTIVATFRAADEPIVVLRFDGVRKRGESFNDPESGPTGAHHRFTISQGVRDIQAAQQFLDEEYRPSRTVVVTFSAAGIDARAALAADTEGALDGWVCVVGPSDLQSALSVISGGIDYVGGGERGVKFGFR
ncbi:MAG: hypothetical protein OER77_06950, partial [Myxococcales bacterium]|nr:hypothetical protein [Myxococcales bacterium]